MTEDKKRSNARPKKINIGKLSEALKSNIKRRKEIQTRKKTNDTTSIT